MTPFIDLLNLEKKLCNRIKFLEITIFEDDRLTDGELNFYREEHETATRELIKCQAEIREYITSHIK